MFLSTEMSLVIYSMQDSVGRDSRPLRRQCRCTSQLVTTDCRCSVEQVTCSSRVGRRRSVLSERTNIDYILLPTPRTADSTDTDASDASASPDSLTTELAFARCVSDNTVSCIQSPETHTTPFKTVTPWLSNILA